MMNTARRRLAVPPARTMGRRRGFTLIELLKVFAILVILEGGLLPTLEKAKWSNLFNFELFDSDTGANPDQVTDVTDSFSALPPSGKFYAFDWTVSAEFQRSRIGGSGGGFMAESVDLGSLGESPIAITPGNSFGDFGGSLLLENVNGDLRATSSSDSGFLTLHLFELDPPVDPIAFGEANQLQNEVAISTAGSMLIPASEVTGKTLGEVLPSLTPLFFEKASSDVPLLLTNDGQHFTNLSGVSAQKVVPEPSSLLLVCSGAAGLIAFRHRRRKKPAPRPGAGAKPDGRRTNPMMPYV